MNSNSLNVLYGIILIRQNSCSADLIT